MAVRLELLDDEATLTDERIEQTVAAVVQALVQQLGARLRG
jgi:phenylalanyl-tRNA synthetase beta chain